MMKMLHAAGCELLTDNVRQSDLHNPNGYFEYERVKNLKSGDVGWLNQAQGRVVKIVSPLLQYLPGSYTYKIFFMQRDLREILASQKKMLNGFHKDSSLEEDRYLEEAYAAHLAQVSEWAAHQVNIDVLPVNYNLLISIAQNGHHQPGKPDQNALFDQLLAFIGQSSNLEGMKKVIDPGLYRNRVLVS